MKKFLITTALTLILAVTTAYASNPIVAGETFYGQCPDTGETIYVKEAPDGLTLADDGSITWPVPIDTPSGIYTFTCKIKEKAGNGKYLFPIEVIGVNPIAEKVIGLTGGEVDAGDVKLTIPCNTVPDGTPISIGSLDGVFPLPFVGADVVKTFSLAPHGIEFTTIPSAAPVFTDLVQMKNHIDELKAESGNGIMLSLTGLTSKNYSLITYQPTVAGIMDWRYVPSTITENADGTFTLTAQLQHFSIYTMIYQQQFTHSETWHTDIEWASAVTRVEALQRAVDVLNTESVHTFTSYLYNAVTPELLGGNKELALGEFNNSQSAAFNLADELNQDTWITEQFHIDVIDTGHIVAGATVPISHYGVVLSPKHEITGEICSPDCGPSYILDRYYGDPDVHEVQRKYKTDPPNDGPYWHNGIDKIIHRKVEDHYTVDTYDDAAQFFQELYNELMSVPPEGGDDSHPGEEHGYYPSPPCTANMVTPYGWLSKPCPYHYNTTQVHCTKGNTTEVCPFHHVIHGLCNYVSGDFCDGNTEVTYGTCNVSGDLHSHLDRWIWNDEIGDYEIFPPELECQEPRRHAGYCEVHGQMGTHCTLGFYNYLCPIHRIYH